MGDVRIILCLNIFTPQEFCLIHERGCALTLHLHKNIKNLSQVCDKFFLKKLVYNWIE